MLLTVPIAVTALLAPAGVFALPQGGLPSSVSSRASSATSVPSSVQASSSSAVSATSVSTAVPSPQGTSTSTSSRLQNFTLPPEQEWCTGRGFAGSQIYCPGEILQTVQLAHLYPDSKTFVDKPTNAPEEEVVAAFYANVRGNNTVEALIDWIETYFRGEGQDIRPTELVGFQEEPDFLEDVSEPLLRGWLQIVHSYWNDLVRVNVVDNQTFASSLIPLNHSFVVPGGRFREAYYWDTLQAAEGMLIGNLYSNVRDLVENFMDFIDVYGFVPNGGRTYYLNRSQPPVYLHLLERYMEFTNDTSILERAVEMGEREMMWWDTNRTITVTGPSGTAHETHRYAVDTSAARPESYLEDWETVNGADGQLGLNTSLYSDISSGAESGMDYSAARWFRTPLASVNDTTAALRSINTNNQIPVDLESILHGSYLILSRYHRQLGNDTRAEYWTERAARSRDAIIDLHWDAESLTFRDYNMTSNSLANIWSTAGYTPYWNFVFPDELIRNQTNAQKAFSGLGYITAHYNGSIPVSLYTTGQQWDSPSVWPPEIYFILRGLENLPMNVTTAPFEEYGQNTIDFSYLPTNHFALEQNQLPQQNVLGDDSRNISTVSSFSANGNTGNLTGLGWRDGLATAIAQRYESAVFCSWYATGGSIPGLLNQLPESDLEATDSVGNTGRMYEKISLLDIDQAGEGGEYEVQTGFGWTNGVAIWISSLYGDRLVRPSCPAIAEEPAGQGAAMSMHRDMSLRPKLVENLAARRLRKRME